MSPKSYPEGFCLNNSGENCVPKLSPSSMYEKIALDIGRLVDEKQVAYGDSFHEAGMILSTLYPNGIQPCQYNDLLAIVRVIDKLFRIANMKDYNGENPWKDIAGYALLGMTL